jgi:hypothetical protein
MEKKSLTPGKINPMKLEKAGRESRREREAARTQPSEK